MKKMTAGILAVALSSALYAGNVENYSEGRTFIGAEVGYALQTVVLPDMIKMDFR